MYYYLLNDNLPISSDEIQPGLTEISEYEYQYRAMHIESSIADTIDKVDMYRSIRSQVCFPIINRGQLWYNHLTLAQKSELNDWYEAWLDITHTFVIPTAPSWLNNTLNKIEPEELL